MEPAGVERHRWESPKGERAGASESNAPQLTITRGVLTRGAGGERRLESISPANYSQINIFQASRLHAQVEIILNLLCAVARDPRKKTVILRRVEQGARELVSIVLGHEHAAHAMLDRFGNSAVLGCEDREPARHCFQH